MGGSSVEIGYRSGLLEVLGSSSERDSHGRLLFICRCDCGGECLASASELISGSKVNCGCAARSRPKDLRGLRFGKLTVLEAGEKRKRQQIWKCRCDCGELSYVSQNDLLSGNTISCGCIKREHMSGISSSLDFVDSTCVQWLENRKCRSDSSSGYKGVHKTARGYSVEIGLQKKRFYVGHYKELEQAVDARNQAEEFLHKGFVDAYKAWRKKADLDPEWAENSPFFFDVKKENGVFYTSSPMGSWAQSMK